MNADSLFFRLLELVSDQNIRRTECGVLRVMSFVLLRDSNVRKRRKRAIILWKFGKREFAGFQLSCTTLMEASANPLWL